MKISRVQLKNIRGFQDLRIGFTQANALPRRTTLIIGRNGTCKTTLLRAIALGLCDQADASALLSEPIGGMLSASAQAGEIEIEIEDQGGVTPLIIRQEIERSEDKESIAGTDFLLEGHTGSSYPQPFVCGYGAGRYGVDSDTGRKYRVIDSVFSLFDDHSRLIDTELTLRRLKDYLGSRKYETTLLGIKRALGLSPEDRIHLPRGGGVELSGPSIGHRVSLEGWADGYRVTFSWLLDLFGWAMRANRINDEGFVVGIVLVDELEQHLHPSMQSKILPRLGEIMPEVQLIATTHSPLVALGARPEELVVLRRQGDEVVADTSVPDFSGYSAEDMLVDAHLFDADVYSLETSRQLNRYQELASIPAQDRSETESQELRRLAQDLRHQQLPEVRESALAQELHRLIEKHGL